MSERPESTRQLVDELVADLEPVRRFPSLSVGLGWVLGIWCGAALMATFVDRPAPDLARRMTTDPAFAAIVLGLAVGAISGALSALASVVPGLEVLERRARGVAWLGVGVAVATGVVAAVLGVGGDQAPVSKDLACFGLSVAVGGAPAVPLVVLTRRGVLQHPGRSAALAVIGAFGLGALAVQLVCHQIGARHALFGHVLVPIVMLGLAGLPLSVWLRGRAGARPG